jgi:uncharacterized membrane protein
MPDTIAQPTDGRCRTLRGVDHSGRRGGLVSDKQVKSHALERMIFFSDAVIAIAITLLALELPIPTGDSPGELLRAFTGAHGREYLAFLVAFALIGGSWMGHHALFAYVADSDNRLMVLNLMALFGFVAVPWATKTLGTAHGGVGLAVFSLVMTILVGSTLLLARHVARAGLLEPGTPDAMLTRIWVMLGVPTVMFAVSIPLAFVVRDFIILLWPVVYIGVAIYSRRSGRGGA